VRGIGSFVGVNSAPPAIRGIWRDDEDARAVYSEAAGIQRIVPRAVAVPADASDVVTLVRWAAEHRVPLTPRGSGSSMAGGAVGAGVVVDLSRLLAIEPVDAARKRVVVGPGAICADVDATAHKSGLRFPIDPSSARFCTIGGMAATNAAGSRTLRYGQTRAWVEGLECVFADGARAWIRRSDPVPRVAALERFAALRQSARAATRGGLRKQSSGYAMSGSGAAGIIDVLVGSEGTLALFTAIEIRLAPIPAASATLLASFASIDDAAAAAAVAAELNASACELLDRTFLEIARRGGHVDIDESADAVLVVEIEDANASRANDVAAAIASGFRDAGATRVETALDDAHATRLWQLRHAASPILAALSRSTISMQVVEDGAVPPARLAEYVRGLRGAITKHGFEGVLFGHAGDGHVHANVLVDVRAPGWRDRLAHLFDDSVELVQSLGGTLAGEHGDGRLRAAALARVWPGDAVDAFRAVKSAFDPAGILNPGVKLPQQPEPLGGPIKYDPSLPPLPDRARNALDRIQRERLWGTSRLELLDG
jgi:FAD/FMN-containing dehydrogenase